MARIRKKSLTTSVTVEMPMMRTGIWAIVLLLATLVAYAPAFDAPYAFDDITSIPTNASIRQLWPLSVPLSPPSNTAVSGRPVVNYSLALNYWLNERLGVDQRPYPDGKYKT